jgi:hypothetical protein
MPAFTFTSPEGKQYTVNGPDGTTKEEAFQHLQTHLGATANIGKREAQYQSEMSDATSNVANLLPGAVRGAASIGSTLLAPYDMAKDAINGKGLSLESNRQRRAETDAGLREMGANPNSVGYKLGKLGGEIAGTAGAGGVVANGVRAVAPGAEALATAIETGGMRAGPTPGLANMGTRVAGGATNGAAQAGMINPADTGKGAVIGGVLPPLMSTAGKVGNAAGRVISGPEVAPAVQQAVSDARNLGYVIPPTQAKPTLANRLLEGFSGKITTAQNASAKNQLITDGLVKNELGIAPETQLSTDALDGVRKEAGKAYKDVASLGKLPANGASFPEGVNVQSSLNQSTLRTEKSVDAAEVVRAWKQANHDATQYYRAYARDANPETLAKAKAAAGQAEQIDSYLEQQLKTMGKDDLLKNLKDARKLIAKTYSAENALNPATGTIDASKFAAMLRRRISRYLVVLRQAGEFALRFPKAAQSVEKMGSLPQVSPLDFGALGTIAVADQRKTSVLRRQACLQRVLLHGLCSRCQRHGAESGLASTGCKTNALLELMQNPDAVQAIYRAAPALDASR